MDGGFSFNGIDIADLGLIYVPEKKNLYQYLTGKFKIHSESFDGHNGGFYYGTTFQEKTFSLRCLYENKPIDQGLFAQIDAVFRQGNSGKLIFKERPWVYYNAVVTAIDFSNVINSGSGLITITMTIYDPFGRCENHANIYEGAMYTAVEQNTGLLDEDRTPETSIITSETTLSSAKSFLLYNGGTQKAAVAVKIAGNAKSGIVIQNSTNDTELKIVSLTKDITTTKNKVYVCDGLNGKCYLQGSGTKELMFLYHDYGFIELEPSFPIYRGIAATAYGNSVYVEFEKDMPNLIGKFIRLEDTWCKITAKTNYEHRYATDTTFAHTKTVNTDIVTMNEMSISSPGNDAVIDSLAFLYEPTFA